MTQCLRNGAVVLALVLAGTLLGEFQARAEPFEHKTFEERRNERGNILRERAKENARAPLPYENVYGPEYDRRYDFYSIGQQIARLAALMQRFADAAGAARAPGFVPVPPPAWAGVAGSLAAPGADVAGVYGPDGPTGKSVRLLLEYRLMVAGNPRLRVGAVKENADKVTASVVTADGSLVEEYTIDKKSGIWTPVR